MGCDLPGVSPYLARFPSSIPHILQAAVQDLEGKLVGGTTLRRWPALARTASYYVPFCRFFFIAAF